LAERLIASLAAPYDINGHRVLVGASVGIAVASDVMSSSEDLLRNSDLALYRAKAAGKGRHCFYADEMDAALQARRLLEIDLREALDKSALEVFFQPLVEIATGRVSGCEALVRWKHPTRGYIPPIEFIPLAEETGLIIPLGEFVLRAACREAASWSRDIRVAVNLSAIQFQTGDLVELVGSALRESGLRPDRLELEITETIMMENKDAVSETLASLRALGVRIALDDFGTGYSSLAYLSSFPFDKIKIDRSFVRDVGNRPEAAAIIQAIATLASTLRMATTAEGVEYAAELDWLRDNGCDEVQGFLFSPPVPARDLRYLIGRNLDSGAGAIRMAG
jgi:predicted signal transduction protein with EAL and GGDEF domain